MAMSATTSYFCVTCGEALQFCPACHRPIHESDWPAHIADPACRHDDVGASCAVRTWAADPHPESTMGCLSGALLITGLAWLFWLLAVEAWDASYRAGWLH